MGERRLSPQPLLQPARRPPAVPDLPGSLDNLLRAVEKLALRRDNG